MTWARVQRALMWLAAIGLAACACEIGPERRQQGNDATLTEEVSVPSEPTNNHDLTMTASFEIIDDSSGQALVLSYQVDNRGTADVYLLNRIPRELPDFTVDPNTIYIHFEDRIIHLEKRIAGPPPGRSPTHLVAPFVTPVRAGDSFSEQVRIALPIQQYREYHPNPDRKGEKVEHYQGVDFTLGYMVKLPGTLEREEDVRGTKALLFTNPPGKLPEAGTLHTPVTALKIPVIP